MNDGGGNAGRGDRSMPARDAGDLPVLTRESVAAARDGTGDRPAVAGVLLAAGTSSRFGGSNKLLADLGGDPVVVRAARALLGADLARVVAVVGHDRERVRAALPPVETVENPDYREGQATSVRAGVEAVRDADAALFALGDMPLVRPETVTLVADAFRAGLGDPVAAAVDGDRGNPVVFGARYFDALADVDGDRGGRRLLLESDDAALVETGDPGVRRDVDTPEDLDEVRERS